MFSKYHKKAVEEKNGSKWSLKNVFYSSKNKEYVSCNGHILLIEKTDEEYENDTMFNPITGFPCDDQNEAGVFNYPNYRRVIPENPEVTFKSYKIFKRKVNKKTIAKDIISFCFSDKEIIFNKQYIDTAISFVSETGKYIVYADSDRGPVLFVSEGRKALVMPIVPKQSLNEEYLEISSGAEYFPKVEKTKAKEIFIAFNKAGEIVGAYSSKKSAETAADDGSVVETIFISKE